MEAIDNDGDGEISKVAFLCAAIIQYINVELDGLGRVRNARVQE